MFINTVVGRLSKDPPTETRPMGVHIEVAHPSWESGALLQIQIPWCRVMVPLCKNQINALIWHLSYILLKLDEAEAAATAAAEATDGDEASAAVPVEQIDQSSGSRPGNDSPQQLGA